MRNAIKGAIGGFLCATVKRCAIASIFERHCPSGLQTSPKTACSTAVERGAFVMLPNKLATPSWNRFMLALK